MKTTKRLHWLAMAGLMAGLAVPALGQDEERRGPRPGGPGGAGSADAEGGALMKALDRNGDGALDQNEIDMAVVVLRRMDQDEDGKVTAKEVASAPQRGGSAGGRPGGGEGRGRGPTLQIFTQMDSDGDGKISKEEAPERMLERFDENDTNGDGFIDKKEQEQMIEMLRQRFQQGGQRPGQRPGGRPDPGAGEGGTDRPKRPGNE